VLSQRGLLRCAISTASASESLRGGPDRDRVVD
jgi:hypothetical protein